MFRELLNLVAEIFYPTRCLNCKKALTDRGVLCPVCRCILERKEFYRGEDYACPHLEGFYLFYDYSGALREALLQAKFYNKRMFVERLAREMKNLSWGELEKRWSLEKNVLVVPIPTDKERAKARGFDVPQEIFNPWCNKENLELRGCLERIKASLPQFGLNKRQRKANVKGCWQVRESVENRQILLVDDIFTSGATMNEAARCLKEAGAAQVYGLALTGGKK